MAGIELTGMKEMQARMLALRKHMKGRGSRNAVRAGGQVIADAMIAATPTQKIHQAGSNSLPPGAVQRDIKVRMSGPEGDPVATIGPGKKTGYVARWVERGHRMVTGGQSKVLANGKTRGPGKVSSKDVQAYPFLRPAFEESVEAAQAKIAETFGAELKEGVK